MALAALASAALLLSCVGQVWAAAADAAECEEEDGASALQLPARGSVLEMGSETQPKECEANETYCIATSGSCAVPIMSLAECGEAARALQLQDTTAAYYTAAYYPMPLGCVQRAIYLGGFT